MGESGQAAVSGDPVAGSAVFPRGSRVNEEGHLEVAGCDVVELAEEHGTPAYIYAEDDIRSRAREYREAFESRSADYEVLFASKSLPCTAAYRLFAEEGLSVDVASGGELHMALKAGFDPDRIPLHGNNKSDEEILFAARAGIRHLILDSFDEIERCERLLDEPQRVLIRVTPGIKPTTHDYITTGQLDSKFGFGLGDGLAGRGIERVGGPAPGAASSTSAAGLGSPTPPRTSRPRSTPTSTSRCAVWPRSLARTCEFWSSRGARWSPTAVSPPTASAPSRRFPGCGPTSPSTAACRTTCGRCSTAPATRR